MKSWASTVAFLRRREGSAVVVMACALLAVVGAAGLALDAGRGYLIKSKLRHAVDAAALAGGASLNGDQQSQKEAIQKFFAANFPDRVMGAEVATPQIQFGAAGRQITVSASAEVPTTLMRVLTHDSIKVSASATVNRAAAEAELVMVLDTTGSMGFGSSWDDAKEAMAAMLQKLDDTSGEQAFYASFIPMTDRINVGTDKDDWLAVREPHKWNGCVEPREEDEGDFKYALTDKTPQELGFLPSSKGYFISKLHKQSYFKCASEILGPTDDVSEIKQKIESLGLKGSGRMDVGMAWAWRMLSPKWQGHWSLPDYPSEFGERRKIVVYITDMFTAAYHYEVGGKAHGETFGSNRGSKKGFEHFVHVCRQMKDQGIEIHAVYANGNQHGVPYMKACASGTDYYHEVTDVEELKFALDEIAGSATRVWLGH